MSRFALSQPDLVLAIDTSAAHCAAALLSGGQLISSRTEPMDKGQAERLMPMIAELLADQGRTWRDLGLIGVGIGPGNFTGVRLAVATARGLSLSLGIRAIGTSRLEALAEGLPRPLAVVEDARRNDVYLQHFENETASDPRLVAFPDLPPLLGNLPLTGSAATTAAQITGGPVLDAPMSLIEAIARLAERRSAIETPHPAPLYLRAADAMLPRDPPPVILP